MFEYRVPLEVAAERRFCLRDNFRGKLLYRSREKSHGVRQPPTSSGFSARILPERKLKYENGTGRHVVQYLFQTHVHVHGHRFSLRLHVRKRIRHALRSDFRLN